MKIFVDMRSRRGMLGYRNKEIKQMTKAEELKNRIIRMKAAIERSPNAHNISLLNDAGKELYELSGEFFANDEWLKAK